MPLSPADYNDPNFVRIMSAQCSDLFDEFSGVISSMKSLATMTSDDSEELNAFEELIQEQTQKKLKNHLSTFISLGENFGTMFEEALSKGLESQSNVQSDDIMPDAIKLIEEIMTHPKFNSIVKNVLNNVKLFDTFIGQMLEKKEDIIYVLSLFEKDFLNFDVDSEEIDTPILVPEFIVPNFNFDYDIENKENEQNIVDKFLHSVKSLTIPVLNIPISEEIPRMISAAINILSGLMQFQGALALPNLKMAVGMCIMQYLLGDETVAEAADDADDYAEAAEEEESPGYDFDADNEQEEFAFDYEQEMIPESTPVPNNLSLTRTESFEVVETMFRTIKQTLLDFAENNFKIFVDTINLKNSVGLDRNSLALLLNINPQERFIPIMKVFMGYLAETNLFPLFDDFDFENLDIKSFKAKIQEIDFLTDNDKKTLQEFIDLMVASIDIKQLSEPEQVLKSFLVTKETQKQFKEIQKLIEDYKMEGFLDE